MRLSLLVSLSLLLASLSGCAYTTVYTIGAGAQMDSKSLAFTAKEARYMSGLVGRSDLDISTICPTGNATVLHRMTFEDTLVRRFTLGIYSPSTTKVFCNKWVAPVTAQP